ncbi:MAG: [protein-PII] uridylyltransferase [Deltaproteobacteria bacterium]|nr:[protein-PII] uridylyltransferase [Deltaproteobacteria bacterium]
MLAAKTTGNKDIAKTSASRVLEDSRRALSAQFENGESRHSFSDAYTEIMDQYFRQSHHNSETGRLLFKKRRSFALLAVGGYGRKELDFHSDIDILILFGSKIPPLAKELVEEFLYPLWDLGFDLGYGVRTIKDCLTLSKSDFEVLTSMMDARFISGDSSLYLSLMESLHKKIAQKKAVEISRWLEDCHKIRMETFGDASHLLEPNLKEGIGGLRDYHQVLWHAKALFELRTPRDLEYHGKLSHREYEGLKKNLQFIWAVRNRLHQLVGRKNDRLNFEYQEDIARWLGYHDKGSFLAVEQFMGKLHRAMASIKNMNRSFAAAHLPRPHGSPKKAGWHEPPPNGLNIQNSEIQFDSATAIVSEPFLLMAVFDQLARSGCALSMETERLIREFLILVDDQFRSSARMGEYFRNILNSKKAFEALDKMFELGFLEAFMPEFSKIRDRVQFDAYHIFPVGRHSLETLKQLKTIGRGKDLLLVDIFSDLPDPEPLFLAGLLHDIGKTGKNHAQKGTEIAETILKRLNYPKSETEQALFLIRHHLLLVETATRRDLGDEKVIVQCARTIEDTDKLKMLYVLAWADARATGPRVWNPWTANLIQELFFKILNIFLGEELATRDASQRARETLLQVQRAFPELTDAEQDTLFSAMSPRYLLNCAPREIIHHVHVLKVLRERQEDEKTPQLAVEIKENEMEGCVDIIFMSKDRPGIFSQMAGVLAINHVNVVAANIYTWGDGTAVDIFKATPHPDPRRALEIWEKVKKDVENVFRGSLPLEDSIREKSQPSILNTGYKPSHPPKIRVDNRVSDFFTLIEVFADDRIGLLYKITRTIFELGLDIRIAKIATKGDQVADIFYVRDLEGQKVEDESESKKIVATLNKVLAQ